MNEIPFEDGNSTFTCSVEKLRGMLPSSSDSSGSEDSERGRGQKRSSNKEALDDKVVEKSPKGRFYRVCRNLCLVQS
jgi:hypothetical protein